MSGHLTSEQIFDWILGDRAPDAQEHLLNCQACNREVIRLAGPLTEFRSSVHAWSRARVVPELKLNGAPQVRFTAASGWRWSLAAVALCLIALFAVTYPAVDRRRQAETAAIDARLLTQIDADLSRVVPGPMEPLSKLVVWEREPAAQTRRKNTNPHREIE